MKTCIILPLELEPYSSERLIVISGHSYEEVRDWFINIQSKPKFINLEETRKHFEWYDEHLETLEKIKDDINKLDKGSNTTVQGSYMYYDLKSYPGNKIRILILKYGFDVTKHNNLITLAHEVLHLCQEFLPQFLNRDIEHEAEAYFHSYIMNKICTAFLEN